MPAAHCPARATITSASIGRLILVPALRSGPLVPGTSIHPQAAWPYAERLCAKAAGVRVVIGQGLTEGSVELLTDEGS